MNEDYKNGRCCSECMFYFRKPLGAPALCMNCHADAEPGEQDEFLCATQ